jgi:hypothetical protein
VNLDKLPQPLWAIALAFLGVILALAVLFHNESAIIASAVLAIASNLVSGALGAFAGHAAGATNNTGGNSVVNNPTQPAPPAQ